MGPAMKIRSRNHTLADAWKNGAQAAAERKKHFGIGDAVPQELRPEVICRAEAAQGPRVIEFNDHVSLCCAGRCRSGRVAPVKTVVFAGILLIDCAGPQRRPCGRAKD